MSGKDTVITRAKDCKNLCLHFVFQRNTERSMPVVRNVARMIEDADEIIVPALKDVQKMGEK